MTLLKLGESLFAGRPVKKEITYSDGVSGEEIRADVYVRQYGLAQARRFLALYNRDADDEQADGELARTIAETIVDAKGDPLFSAADVCRFKQDLVFALLGAIGEANGPKPKKSPKKKNSSAN